ALVLPDEIERGVVRDLEGHRGAAPGRDHFLDQRLAVDDDADPGEPGGGSIPAHGEMAGAALDELGPVLPAVPGGAEEQTEEDELLHGIPPRGAPASCGRTRAGLAPAAGARNLQATESAETGASSRVSSVVRIRGSKLAGVIAISTRASVSPAFSTAWGTRPS